MTLTGPVTGAGGGSGGGGFTPTSWAVEDAFILPSATANQAVPTPGPNVVTYDPTKEYQLAITLDGTGTSVPVAGLPSIICLYPEDQGKDTGVGGNGIGSVSDPANGQVDFYFGIGTAWDLTGYIRVFSGGTIGAGPAAAYTGFDDASSNGFGFRATDGRLCTIFQNNGGLVDFYFITFSRQVLA